jgi:ribose 5-phosphate isomerase B
VVAVGARTTPAETIGEIVRAFLSTEFEGGRHAQRVEKIARLENHRD